MKLDFEKGRMDFRQGGTVDRVTTNEQDEMSTPNVVITSKEEKDEITEGGSHVE